VLGKVRLPQQRKICGKEKECSDVDLKEKRSKKKNENWMGLAKGSGARLTGMALARDQKKEEAGA